tara:strand:- start:411 stop:707 length:297 start_codon:yes stop_codon:yes gene_type:complete
MNRCRFTLWRKKISNDELRTRIEMIDSPALQSAVACLVYYDFFGGQFRQDIPAHELEYYYSHIDKGPMDVDCDVLASALRWVGYPDALAKERAAKELI